MNKFAWYKNRLQTMSVPEIFYRIDQQFKKNVEKMAPNKGSQGNDFEKVLTESFNVVENQVPLILQHQFDEYDCFAFFGSSLPIDQSIEWHLDILSGKHFPNIFSKDIDIRSDKYGSAKVVWEINRLQFLLPIAIRYNAKRNKDDLELFIELINSWVKANPYLKGVNWYSNIEVNIRLIVWYFCWQVLWQDEKLKADKVFTDFVTKTWLPSIYEHCIYSFNNPSKFSSANNHLVAEHSGLFVAACCWKFQESQDWKQYALNGLEKEIIKQNSKNGINKEEAAEYIQFITDFFLIPYAVGNNYGVEFSEIYKQQLYKISEYLINLLDVKNGYRKYGDEDDGKVLVVSSDPHFDNFSSILTSAAVIFGDEKFKTVDKGFDLKNWLLWGRSGFDKFNNIQLKEFQKKSAFYIQEGNFIFKKQGEGSDKEIYLHFDAAPLGYLSIAAHGHADALSIALHLDGDPILVDVGTFTYHTHKEWRNYFISTLAHNTICIDGKNQAYQAGPTMWLKHYKTDVIKAIQMDDTEMVSAKHSGYDKYGCSHERTVSFNRLKEHFVIDDEVSLNNKSHSILQPWHLHPEVEIEKLDTHIFSLKHRQGRRKIKISCDSALSIEIKRAETDPILGWYSKSFLQREPTRVIFGCYSSKGAQKLQLSTVIEII
jgi:hypothetical protein